MYSKQVMIVPSGHDPEKLEQYRRRIDLFQERQLAARARNAVAQRRFRVLIALVAVALVLTGATTAYIAYSLSQLKGTVVGQLQSAQAAVAASNERWKDARQALVDNRNALQASEEVLASFRAETRASLLLPVVDTYLERLHAGGHPGLEDPADAKIVAAQLKEIVQPAIARQLAQKPDTTDAQAVAQIQRIVDARLAGVIQQFHRKPLLN